MNQVDQDTAILEALDWDYEPPCEHTQHDTNRKSHKGDGWAMIKRLKPCGCAVQGSGFLIVCKKVWDSHNKEPVFCLSCNQAFSREQSWQFIALVKPSK